MINMKDKISKFLFGTVILSGMWTLFFRIMEIFIVGQILINLIKQFRG